MARTRQPARRPAASIVILNWNGKDFLKIVLPSLKKQRFRNFETIVVDNGSDDGSVDYVRARHPGVRVVALDRNLGFAGGNNAGMKVARGEFVGLLNNDVEAHRDWVGEMVRAMRQHPKAGSAATTMLQFDHRDRIDEAGGWGTWHGLFGPRGKGSKVKDHFRDLETVLYASGGAVLFRQTALKDVGLLDESFFAYLEDVDWGLRAQLRGWSCVFVPSAQVYHIGGGTFKKRPSGFAQRLWTRNTQLLIVKDYPAGALIRYCPKIVFSWMKTLWGAVKEGWLGDWVRAQLSFWWLLPRALRQRHRIQQGRTVDLRYLNTVMRKRFPLSSKLLRRKAA